MAKKVRTPPPPRRVQTPQRRDHRKAAPHVGAQRPPWIYAAAGAAAAALVAGVVLAVVLIGHNGKSSTLAPATTYNALPGVTKKKAPWTQDYEFLADRLAPLGLTTLAGHSGLVEHYHAHLDIFVNGKRVVVPADVGINPGAGYLTELHTHDARGVIHIESEKKQSYRLGQFIAEWGVFLNSRCIGAYCDGLKWYVNGKQQTGNPGDLVLKPHQEIVIVVGKLPAQIPSSFKFAAGE